MPYREMRIGDFVELQGPARITMLGLKHGKVKLLVDSAGAVSPVQLPIPQKGRAKALAKVGDENVE